MEVKVLTIKQPWCWLILDGLKDVENRSWSTDYRGVLYLHAGQRFDYGSFDFIFGLGEPLFNRMVNKFALDFSQDYYTPTIRDKSDFGKILGCVDLFDCVQGSGSKWASEGSYHWLFRNPSLIEPVECRGNLGLWNFNFEEV